MIRPEVHLDEFDGETPNDKLKQAMVYSAKQSPVPVIVATVGTVFDKPITAPMYDGFALICKS